MEKNNQISLTGNSANGVTVSYDRKDTGGEEYVLKHGLIMTKPQCGKPQTSLPGLFLIDH